MKLVCSGHTAANSSSHHRCTCTRGRHSLRLFTGHCAAGGPTGHGAGCSGVRRDCTRRPAGQLCSYADVQHRRHPPQRGCPFLHTPGRHGGRYIHFLPRPVWDCYRLTTCSVRKQLPLVLLLLFPLIGQPQETVCDSLECCVHICKCVVRVRIFK